ncbi:hypothetical protein [uncultured Dokdonia sp.]|uniref:hypothetical protein n=1 Tax=uncultured Dokdonia sp. TaxID=575653 RepID=UPI002604038F|nr:hypothetical protein [uncultured Dokdonia sp.]
MKQPFLKHITTFLFLVAFLIPRIVDIHAFDHLSGDDDLIACELCDSISHTQELDLFLGTLSYTTEAPLNIPNAYVPYSIYHSPLAKIATPTTVYNKPPPIFLLG